MKTVKRIDPISAAKVCAVVGVVLGVLFALATIVIYIFGNAVGYDAYMTSEEITAYALNIVILPINYAITMFIGAFVISLIYNVIAKKIGGVKIDLK